MKERNGYPFIAEQREAKLLQFTGRLVYLGRLVDWQGLARAVNDPTRREGLRPKSGRPPYPTEAMLKVVERRLESSPPCRSRLGSDWAPACRGDAADANESPQQ